MSGLGLDFGGQFRVPFVNEIVTKMQPLNLRVYIELDKSERDLGHPTGVCWRSKVGVASFCTKISRD